MEMNKAFFLAKEVLSHDKREWRVIDAKGEVLGRLATRIADILRGKDKPYYTPHTDCGDFVVVINADKIKLTGNKMSDKLYVTFSGWRGGKKQTPAKELLAKHPTELIHLAVKRMLPKNNLSRDILSKLKLYAGPEHPHVAQVSKAS